MKIIISILILICFQSSCLAHSVEYYKGVLALAAVIQDDDVEPVKCLCGGSGRSGDGLGPCGCPDGCTGCTPKREEITKKPIQGHPTPKIELLYFSTENCPPCIKQSTEFQRMKTTGWKIGTSQTDHIIKSNESIKYEVTDFPCFVLLNNGIEVNRHYGFMDSYQIAAFRDPAPAVSQMQVVQGITVPNLRTPFEKTIAAVNQMLGAEYKANRFVTVTSPERVEMSIEKSNGKIHIRFHGNKPKVSAAGIFESEVTHMIAEGNRITVYWNGVIGLLKNHLTIEFE